jgi:hypothetical protein
VGDLISDYGRQYPEKQITVLCGHVHYARTAQIAPNIGCYTGGAEYWKPEIQRVFEFGPRLDREFLVE